MIFVHFATSMRSKFFLRVEDPEEAADYLAAFVEMGLDAFMSISPAAGYTEYRRTR